MAKDKKLVEAITAMEDDTKNNITVKCRIFQGVTFY